MRRFAPLAIAASLLVPAVTLAATQAVAADPKPNCASPMTTYEINVCSERALAKADAKLNAAFQKALAEIKASDNPSPYDAASWEKALRASQRAWLAFRDADCKGLVPMSWTGGTGTTAAVLGCLQSKTEARTIELEDLIAVP